MREAIAILALLLVVGGCSSQPVQLQKQLGIEQLFHDTHFAPVNGLSVAEIFSADDRMKDFLDKEISPQQRRDGKPRALFDAINRNGRFWLEYDSRRTRTASETFDSRRGNCMSMVIMASALAKALGLEVHYQKISVEDVWARDVGTLILVGHVNLVIGDRHWSDPYNRTTPLSIVVDFLPLEEARGLRGVEISEAAIVAMFLNNRAAEELIAGHLDAAYGLARDAVRTDPSFLGAINTLGVIYRRHRNLPEAEVVFRAMLEREPDNTLVLANLTATLKDQGKFEESNELAQRLRKLEPVAPFHFMDAANEALAKGDFEEARVNFKLELDRNPGAHEAHFGLTRVYLELGKLEAARDHLREAVRLSGNREDQERYANKLDRLRIMSVR